jgi:hypothetical protein
MLLFYHKVLDCLTGHNDLFSQEINQPIRSQFVRVGLKRWVLHQMFKFTVMPKYDHFRFDKKLGYDGYQVRLLQVGMNDINPFLSAKPDKESDMGQVPK